MTTWAAVGLSAVLLTLWSAAVFVLGYAAAGERRDGR